MTFRLRIVARGVVQGVGFRPFVHRLASALDLQGWVSNSSEGVTVEVEGPRERLEEFLLRLEPERPPRASIQSCEFTFLDAVGFSRFEIRPSDGAGPNRSLVLPDIATCPECVAEVFDPGNRRFLYPFTNCTNCGPRYSILLRLPYDRPNTTMAGFSMCSACREEYENPQDRRFHAQPNACPACGPQLELWDAQESVRAGREKAWRQAVAELRAGRILALKGLGGFQLLVDASNETAVRRLRERKRREEKPFAVMAPAIEFVSANCEVSPLETRLLLSPESPIALLRRRETCAVAASVAPGNPHLGVMLPCTPLHHILTREFGGPLVATSGNLSDEPICIDEREAAFRLADVADAFLVHDRPIRRQVDDSVARVILGREQILRRARGYAPLPIRVRPNASPMLAAGSHLKNTVALAIPGAGDDRAGQVMISQHVGDLETPQARDAFVRAMEDLVQLFEVAPEVAVCDPHPDYASAAYVRHRAGRGDFRAKAVPHHWAHVASCAADNDLSPPFLGVAWDGAGCGTDGTIWGGEFFRVDGSGFTRAAHLRPFPLPGAGSAMKEPRRAALGVLHTVFGGAAFDMLRRFPAAETSVLRRMLEKAIQCPVTTSAGRLFDAVASIAGLRQHASFEGQAAMELEFSTVGGIDDRYDYAIAGAAPMIVDWAPTIRAIVEEREHAPPGVIAAKFHNTLAEIVVEIAAREREDRVVLSGGCFQNRYLTERTVFRLQAEGFKAYWHQRVPPNDGGIALGQIAALLMMEHGVGDREECRSTTPAVST